MRRNGTVESNRAKLAKQMKELTEAFFRVEREKIVVRGLNYYSDHVTGKLDAISRGLEARYLLLNEQETYRYPEVGKSGALGSWRFTDTQFGYTVSDHSFDHLNERKQELVALIESLHDLPFEQFRGLNIYGAPFMIRDVLPDGTIEAFSGKAMGQDQMIVSGSIPSTFIHEFGHNWDAAYGNHEEYLSLRGRTGYKPASNAWKDRVEENFAEDFTAIFLPDSYPRVHKAEFAEPSPEEAKALRDWIRQKEQEGGSLSAYRVELNGAAVVPSVIVSDDGKLQVSGEADRTVVGELFNVASGQTARIEIPANGSFESTIELPGKGIYQLLIGKFNSTIVYQ